jgi:hypothetical protein
MKYFNNPRQTTQCFNLTNPDNYNSTIATNHISIITSYNKIILEYIQNITTNKKRFSENILIKGLDTISHIFKYILYYSKNVELASYHAEKALFLYIEFIDQITDDQNMFVILSCKDACVYVYKKILTELNKSYYKQNETDINEPDFFTYLHDYIYLSNESIHFLIHPTHEDINNDDGVNQYLQLISICIFSKYQMKIITSISMYLINNKIPISKYLQFTGQFVKKIINYDQPSLDKIHKNISNLFMNTDILANYVKDDEEVKTCDFITHLICFHV